jgi:hypothetical protein
VLAERKSAICARWLEAVLAGYGEATALRWRRVRDPFANPVGHAFQHGLPLLFDAVAGEGEPPAEALAALEAIVRIRSVQEAVPSRALGFLRLLRGAVQAEAPGANVDAQIEGLLLRAFDLYARFREQMLQLRQEELKRSVASILRRWHGPQDDLVQLSVQGR